MPRSSAPRGRATARPSLSAGSPGRRLAATRRATAAARAGARLAASSIAAASPPTTAAPASAGSASASRGRRAAVVESAPPAAAAAQSARRRRAPTAFLFFSGRFDLLLSFWTCVFCESKIEVTNSDLIRCGFYRASPIKMSTVVCDNIFVTWQNLKCQLL